MEQTRWNGWDSWIRTNDCRSQSPVPFHLAISQYNSGIQSTNPAVISCRHLTCVPNEICSNGSPSLSGWLFHIIQVFTRCIIWMDRLGVNPSLEPDASESIRAIDQHDFYH